MNLQIDFFLNYYGTQLKNKDAFSLREYLEVVESLTYSKHQSTTLIFR